MCGIAGIISSESAPSNWISQSIGQLSHRGPNALGTCRLASDTVQLGHARLSILDLSEAANQPMYSSSGRHVIVFNGEIYNFKSVRDKLTQDFGVVFKTTSDTEVMLEAFEHMGTRMITEMEGMFAAAIVEVASGKVFLFRDRLGKKPLYYYQSPHLFAFGSELKAILAIPEIKRGLQVDHAAITNFLHLGFIPEPQTIYKEVKKFPSGSVGEIDRNLKLSLQRYWAIENEFSVRADAANIDAVSRLEQILTNATATRLVSDVPVGCFLSGGVDSSLVSAIASKLVPKPLNTFSIGFSESEKDESIYAEKVAAILKTDHTTFTLREEEALHWLDSYLDQFDEPFSDTSAIPTLLVSKLARTKVTVALTGDGGDEIFLGYGAYQWANRLDYFKSNQIKQLARHFLRATGSNRYLRASEMFQSLEPEYLRSHIFSQEQYLFSQREVDLLLKNKSIQQRFTYRDAAALSRLTAAEKQSVFDINYYLKDDLLTKVDRASMMFGLECRCPLLDQHVIKFGVNLPYQLKINRGEQKWILKQILKKYLPAQLVERRKQGFSIPLARWLKNEMRFMTEQYLSKEVTRELGLFDEAVVEELKHRFASGQDYLYNRIWAMAVIQRWLTRNI